MDKEFIKKGLKFECNGCSMCCRFKGGVVRLSQDDLERLAEWAELTCDQFITVYCRYIEGDDGKSYLCLKNLHGAEETDDCIFWDKAIPGCQAYSARPAQCSTYPFWSNVLESGDRWRREKEVCPGINEGALHSGSEILEQLELYEKRVPLAR